MSAPEPHGFADYVRQYQALVRAKDPATMEKRRKASECPVCGARLIDGAHRRTDG